MRLILLCHPPSLGSTSMPRFARMIGEGMRARGHSVEYVTSSVVMERLPLWRKALRKWLRYADQFLLFPPKLRSMARRASADTLFVVMDQALGMWVPSIRRRPHVVHCHDFLAQRAALGEFPENPTALSGRIYQRLICRGYRQAENFISVSMKTRQDLHRFLRQEPKISEVVYNPLNNPFLPLPRKEALSRLEHYGEDLKGGFILHVGGNQWYKNRLGVVEIYGAYCRRTVKPLPLLMVGKKPSAAVQTLIGQISSPGRIIIATDFDDAQVHGAYASATALLFPSLEEGFGWPIAEAQACGCPVLTTAVAPMAEVGGDAAMYLPRRPMGDPGEIKAWASECAKILDQQLNLNSTKHAEWIDQGLCNVRRFKTDRTLDVIESIYRSILVS